MKFSSNTLHEPEITLPLPFPIKLIVEYRPGGVLVDHAEIVVSTDPEAVADEIVRAKAWDLWLGYRPSDVWVDGCM